MIKIRSYGRERIQLCTQRKTIWPNFTIVYTIDSFQDHMTWFLHCVPNSLLSRPFDLILPLCTQLNPFTTIWPDFYHCVPNWLLSRPFDLILPLCTQLSPFKTIWPDFCIVYPVGSFQDHMTWIFHCVPHWFFSRPYNRIFYCVSKWLLSRPFDLILSLCTLLTPFKTIWPNFIIVYSIDSFQDHMTWFLQ